MPTVRYLTFSRVARRRKTRESLEFSMFFKAKQGWFACWKSIAAGDAGQGASTGQHLKTRDDSETIVKSISSRSNCKKQELIGTVLLW